MSRLHECLGLPLLMLEDLLNHFELYNKVNRMTFEIQDGIRA